MGEVLSNKFDPLGAARPLAPLGADLRATSGAGNHGNAPGRIVDLPVETWGPAARGEVPAGPCLLQWGDMPDLGLRLVLAALILFGGLGVICHLAGVFG